MTSRTIFYSPDESSPNRGRQFEIHLSSTLDGYSADVDEIMADGRRWMRRHHRGFFIADVQAALRLVVVVAGTSEPASAEAALYLKANMVGWPEG